MRQHTIKTDTLAQQVLEAGEGPLVILCHGFPELSWSWRRQLPALAQAGYRAVAPDMRGYGGTQGPQDGSKYTILELVGDMVELVRALGETEAVIVGHDWGAPVAWHAALLRPDIFRGVVGLSVPFQARRPTSPPIATMKAIARAKGLGEFYMVRFQDPSAGDEFEADVEGGLRKGFWCYDGATPDGERATGFFAPGQSFLSSIPDHATLPAWMSEEEFQTYVRAFEATGFKGPLAWYRNLDRNWELMAQAQDKIIEVPGLFIVGDRDPVRGYAGAAEAELSRWVPKLKGHHVIPGAGHWIQQERPEEINALVLEFLNGL